MLKAQFPVEKANQAIRDGSLPRIMQAMMDELRPEAAYFYAEDGLRTAVMVFDLKDPSRIPVVAEPLFMGLNASVEFRPVMNREELQTGIADAMKKLG
jgi:hypothetical protein